MELVVLLLRPHNKTAVREALKKFIDTPNTMTQSLKNIETVLTCIAADGIQIDVEPLDIFRFIKFDIYRFYSPHMIIAH